MANLSEVVSAILAAADANEQYQKRAREFVSAMNSELVGQFIEDQTSNASVITMLDNEYDSGWECQLAIHVVGKSSEVKTELLFL